MNMCTQLRYASMTASPCSGSARRETEDGHRRREHWIESASGSRQAFVAALQLSTTAADGGRSRLQAPTETLEDPNFGYATSAHRGRLRPGCDIDVQGETATSACTNVRVEIWEPWLNKTFKLARTGGSPSTCNATVPGSLETARRRRGLRAREVRARSWPRRQREPLHQRR